MIKVTVWNEYFKDKQGTGEVAKVYPEGFHNVIAAALNKEKDIKASASLISDAEQGLTEKILDNTDVLIWWGHCHHGEVEDRFVRRVIDRVQRGMGAIFLHSAHKSKPFMQLMGTSGYLCWREANEKERVWVSSPAHPIAAGLPESFVLPQEEMYGEPFGIPSPDDTVFIGWFQGGNVFRSGVTFTREYGKIFYFQPGHETHPTFRDANVQKVIANAVRWAAPFVKVKDLNCPNVAALEAL